MDWLDIIPTYVPIHLQYSLNAKCLLLADTKKNEGDRNWSGGRVVGAIEMHGEL